MSDSYLEDSFALWLRQNPDLPAHEREYRFAEGRKWRLDFAWVAAKVAVEIEGISPKVGRHQRLPGFLADAEKYEAALRLGWTVYRVPGPWVATGGRRGRHVWRLEVLETLRMLLVGPGGRALPNC